MIKCAWWLPITHNISWPIEPFLKCMNICTHNIIIVLKSSIMDSVSNLFIKRRSSPFCFWRDPWPQQNGQSAKGGVGSFSILNLMLQIFPPLTVLFEHKIENNLQYDFPELRGGDQRPFGTFPKIHPFWCGRPSLMYQFTDNERMH